MGYILNVRYTGRFFHHILQGTPCTKPAGLDLPSSAQLAGFYYPIKVRHEMRGRPKGFKHTEVTKRKISEKIKALSQSGDKNPSWKGGKQITKNGNVSLYSPDHPYKNIHNTVLEHRIVIEKVIGRYLTREEVVHHINGNPQDNRYENLLLLSNTSKHTALHNKMRGKNKTIVRKRGNSF